MRLWISENGGLKVALARRLKISGASMSNLLMGGGASYGTAKKFAELVCLPLDELLGPPSTSTEDAEPYPSRVRAIEAARLLKLSDEAIAAVQELALASEGDPGERWWFERIQRADADLRDPYRPKSGDAPAFDDLTRPRIARDAKAIVARAVANLDAAKAPRAKPVTRS